MSVNDELPAPRLPLRRERFRLHWHEQGRAVEKDFDTFDEAARYRLLLRERGIVGRMVRIVTTVEE